MELFRDTHGQGEEQRWRVPFIACDQPSL
jgi:hypothetical protein